MTTTTTDPTIWPTTRPPQLRDHNGHWSTHPDTARRDDAVLARIDAGDSFRTVAATLGYASPSSVHSAYQRALIRAGRPTPDLTRRRRTPCTTCGCTTRHRPLPARHAERHADGPTHPRTAR